MFNKETITIKSKFKDYQVFFDFSLHEKLDKFTSNQFHLVIDENVKKFYENIFPKLFKEKIRNALVIKATEDAKSLDKISGYIQFLQSQDVKRSSTLIAFGGGIIQDITSFIASIYMRGIDWFFFPTTLLAQADSCIGSKSSINLNTVKNFIGTYNPPNEIYVSADFLRTLSDNDISSGIGEIIKIFGIYGREKFLELKKDYPYLRNDFNLLQKYIRGSLLLKKLIIEIDEFDKNERLVLNYGHTFGHAIEASTNYVIPHGIAVSMGCDFANFVSMKMGYSDGSTYELMNEISRENYKNFKLASFSENVFFNSIYKDKKNVDEKLALIIPNNKGFPKLTKVEKSPTFNSVCLDYLFNHLTFSRIES